VTLSWPHANLRECHCQRLARTSGPKVAHAPRLRMDMLAAIPNAQPAAPTIRPVNIGTPNTEVSGVVALGDEGSACARLRRSATAEMPRYLMTTVSSPVVIKY